MYSVTAHYSLTVIHITHLTLHKQTHTHSCAHLTLHTHTCTHTHQSHNSNIITAAYPQSRTWEQSVTIIVCTITHSCHFSTHKCTKLPRKPNSYTLNSTSDLTANHKNEGSVKPAAFYTDAKNGSYLIPTSSIGNGHCYFSKMYMVCIPVVSCEPYLVLGYGNNWNVACS